MATLTLTVPEQSQNIQGVAVIKAPLEKVFEAHTNADLFKQWFARGNDATIHKFDARSGGAWHLTEKSAEGEYSFCGSCHEVAKNERIIWTFEFLGLPERGHVAIERMDLVRIDDNTTEIRTLSTPATTGTPNPARPARPSVADLEMITVKPSIHTATQDRPAHGGAVAYTAISRYWAAAIP